MGLARWHYRAWRSSRRQKSAHATERRSRAPKPTSAVFLLWARVRQAQRLVASKKSQSTRWRLDDMSVLQYDVSIMTLASLFPTNHPARLCPRQVDDSAAGVAITRVQHKNRVSRHSLKCFRIRLHRYASSARHTCDRSALRRSQ